MPHQPQDEKINWPAEIPNSAFGDEVSYRLSRRRKRQ